MLTLRAGDRPLVLDFFQNVKYGRGEKIGLV